MSAAVRRAAFALILVSALGAWVAFSATSTLYVDQTSASCSDGGPGTPTQPFCTIGAANAVAGQTVVVNAGTYAENVTPKNSGTATAPIVYEANPVGMVTVTGQVHGFTLSSRSWITIRGFNVTATTGDGIYAAQSSNITLSGNHVSYAGQPVSGKTARGITLSGVVDSFVIDNTSDHNSDFGISLAASTTNVSVSGNVTFDNARGFERAASGIDVSGSSGNTLQFNICHDNEDSGIEFRGGASNNLAVGNVLYRNGDHGVDVSNAPNHRIVSNSVYKNVTTGILVEGTSTGTSLANNVSVDNAINSPRGVGNIRVDPTAASGTTLDYDQVLLHAPGAMIVWGSTSYTSLSAFVAATGQEPHGLEADPLWEAADAGDLHLLAGSPAIDSASSAASGESAVDADGNPRVDDPQTPNTGVGPRAYDDRGAYEFPGTTNFNTPVPVPSIAPPPTATAASATPTAIPPTPTATPRPTSTPAVTSTATPRPTATVTLVGTVDEVHYTFLGPISVAFDWRGSARDIRYGLTTAYSNSALAATPNPLPYSSTGPFQEVVLSGLQAGATYHYSIGGGADHTFLTAPTTSFRFDAIGDIGDAQTYPNMGITQSQIASDSPAFVVTVGDLTYANAHGQAAIDRHFNDVMVWSRTAAYMPVWGNHEWDSSTDDLRNYKGRFALPNAQTSSAAPALGCCGEDWSWFDVAGVRFIAYPEPYSSAVWPEWQSKADAIFAAAQANPAIDFIVTFGHRPAYSTGHHPGDPTLASILGSLGAKYPKYRLNVNGHSHDYERFTPINNVVHITAGGGGATLETPWSSTDARTAFRAMHLAHLRVDVSATQMHIDAVCGPPTSNDDISCSQGAVIDTVTLSRPSSPTATPAAASPTPTRVPATPTATAKPTATPASPSPTATPIAPTPTATAQATATPSSATPTPAPSGLLITDPYAVFSVPLITEPGLLSSIVDLIFGTRVTRVTGITGASFSWSGPPLGSGSWGADARHHYSKDQPWNSDASLIVVQNGSPGTPSAVYLDGATYAPRYGKCGNYSLGDDRWHPTAQHPHERINVNGSNLEWFDVTTCTQTRRWTLPFAVDGFGQGEGNASNDGRYVLLSNATQMFVVEMDPLPGRIGPPLAVNSCGLADCSIDWVSVSPSGRYAVVSYNGDHPRVYDINASTLALTERPMPVGSPQCSGHDPSQGYIFDLGHADMAPNPFDNDKDVLIGQRRSWCPSTVGGKAMGSVILVRLEDGNVTTLTDPTNEASSHHISTRAYDRPGWVYVSYYAASGKRFNDELVAIKMDGSQSVERLAHKHSSESVYRAESHGVPSRDGLRVMFASDWAASCGILCGSSSDIKAYVVDTRALRIPVNPTPTPTSTPKPTSTPVPTTVPTASPTLTATATPKPTATAAPPPLPTATPTSSPVSTATATPSAQANLVGNPGFESSTSGWNTSGSCGSAVTLDRASGGQSGSFSATLTNTGTTACTCSLNDSPNWVTSTTSGVYTGSIWARAATAGAPLKLRFREYNGSTSVGSATVDATLTTTWQRVTLSYTPASPGSTLDFNAYVPSAAPGVCFYVDDATIVRN